MHKRLFFGFEIYAPWPEKLPQGRVLKDKNRHLTFLFLGNVDFSLLEPHLRTIPLPNFKVGIVGKFEQQVFLPKKNSRCVSWVIEWLENVNPLLHYRKELSNSLQQLGLECDQRELLPHVTVARRPFDAKVWRDQFRLLPCYLSTLHLYESLGHLTYHSLWSYKFTPPYLELSHTADIAYTIYGENYEALYIHGAVALAETYPPLLNYLQKNQNFSSIEDVVIALNEMITKVDSEVGSPYKAISFHGKIEKKEPLLEWEMIIDV